MKRIILVLVLLILLAGGYWWTTRNNDAAAALPQVIGWGTIEAETINLTAEIGGQIKVMNADEGDEVGQGDLLIELDPALWRARRNQAAASLATARANLAEVKTPPRPEAIAVAAAELAQAQAAREGTYGVWQQAQAIVNNPLELNTRIGGAQGQIAVLGKQVEAAQAALKEGEIRRDEAYRNQSSDEAITSYQAAARRADAARGNLASVEAELAGAHNRLDLLSAMRDNPLTLVTQANTAQTAYELAEATVLVAEARLSAAKAGPRSEAVAIAKAQVQRAEAALRRIDVQLDKLRLRAPRSGVVLARPANPGELAVPGETLLDLGDLDQVTLRVFIPETQIGRVGLGQPAQIRVDAYPGEIFAGQVTFIAQEAEFTPQSVQTREERVKLVFAVKISLDNPDHRLKPGMPATAEILVNVPVELAATPTPQPEPSPAPTAATTPVPLPTARPTATASPTPVETEPAITAEVITWGLNVRSGPGMEFPVIAHLAQGGVVPVIEAESNLNWVEVQLADGGSGWISNNPAYVKITGLIGR